MRNESNAGDRPVAIGLKSLKVKITPDGFEKIERAGEIKLSAAMRDDVECALDSYVRRCEWSAGDMSAKARRAHLKRLRSHVDGLLDIFGHVERKLSDSLSYDPSVALLYQTLLGRAQLHPLEFVADLKSIRRTIQEDIGGRETGGRPKDIFLTEFFCEMEDIFAQAGGRQSGITKTLDHLRTSPFTSFVSAVLRHAPKGIGPGTSQAVAAAWERQLEVRNVAQARTGGPPAEP